MDIRKKFFLLELRSTGLIPGSVQGQCGQAFEQSGPHGRLSMSIAKGSEIQVIQSPFKPQPFYDSYLLESFSYILIIQLIPDSVSSEINIPANTLNLSLITYSSWDFSSPSGIKYQYTVVCNETFTFWSCKRDSNQLSYVMINAIGFMNLHFCTSFRIAVCLHTDWHASELPIFCSNCNISHKLLF